VLVTSCFVYANSVSRKLAATEAANRGDTATSAASAAHQTEEVLSDDAIASKRRRPAPMTYWTTGPKDAPGKSNRLQLFAMIALECALYILDTYTHSD
jgi:hypothetical protein